MGDDFSNAKRYLRDEHRSISGVEIDPEWSVWFELYCVAFLVELESQGFVSDSDFAKLLSDMDEYNDVGSFHDGSGEQRAEMAAYGLIVFDRILRAEKAKVDHFSVFCMHQELMECYGFVLKDFYGLIRSRNATDTLHKKNREARDFVRAEWALHRSAYNANKTAFACDYVKRVWNELGVSVREKTVREVWLVDTPSAGK